jgi:hypothetical protein
VIVLLPAAMPATTPVLILTVATDVLDELHTPPPVASASVILLPLHTLVVPVIGDTTGNELIVTIVLTMLVQPAALVSV